MIIALHACLLQSRYERFVSHRQGNDESLAPFLTETTGFRSFRRQQWPCDWAKKLKKYGRFIVTCATWTKNVSLRWNWIQKLLKCYSSNQSLNQVAYSDSQDSALFLVCLGLGWRWDLSSTENVCAEDLSGDSVLVFCVLRIWRTSSHVLRPR